MEALIFGSELWNRGGISRPAKSSRKGVVPVGARRACSRSTFVLVASFVCALSLAPQARAGFIFDFAPQNAFQLVNTNADGVVMAKSQGLVLTGGNNGSGNPGTTDYLAVALNSGTVNFGWSYASLDMPTFDFAGYLLNSTFSPLADTDGMSGVGAFTVSAGESFGFRVGTADNTGEPGILTVTSASTSAVPEPATAAMMLVVLGLVSLKRSRRYFRSVPGLLAGLFASLASLAQAQPYSATNVTGQLVLTRTV